jgi:hypothetical protein
MLNVSFVNVLWNVVMVSVVSISDVLLIVVAPLFLDIFRRHDIPFIVFLVIKI